MNSSSERKTGREAITDLVEFAQEKDIVINIQYIQQILSTDKDTGIVAQKKAVLQVFDLLKNIYGDRIFDIYAMGLSEVLIRDLDQSVDLGGYGVEESRTHSDDIGESLVERS